MAFLLMLHSGLRWLVIAVMLIAALRYLHGWLTARPFGDHDALIWRIFQAVFGLQLLAGLGLFASGFSGQRAEHAVTMLIAFGLTHMAGRFRDAPDATRFRNLFLLLVVTFVLLYAAIARLLGWDWLAVLR